MFICFIDKKMESNEETKVQAAIGDHEEHHYQLPTHDWAFNKIFIFPNEEITSKMLEDHEQFENIDIENFNPPS